MTTSAAVENPYAGQGAVLLDIGGDVGALVVSMPAELEGVEVEIRPVMQGSGHSGHDHDHAHAHDRGHAHHPHVAVVSRPVADGRVPSLVFSELTEGRYELYEKETDAVRLTVAVVGGEVTHAVWPR